MKTYISHLLHPFELGSFIIAVMVGVFALISTPPFYDPAPEEELFLPRIILIFFGFVPYILIALYLRSRAGVEVNNSLRRMRLTILDKTAITIFVLLILMLIIIPLFQQWHSDKMALKLQEAERVINEQQIAFADSVNKTLIEECRSKISHKESGTIYDGYLYHDGALHYYKQWSQSGRNTLENANLEQFTCVNYEYAHDGTTVWRQGVPLVGADPATFSLVSGQSNTYYKDKSNVYRYGKLIKNADPATFTSLEGDWFRYSKDEQRVYFEGVELGGLSPEAFRARIENEVEGHRQLYHDYILRPRDYIKIEDPETFEYLGRGLYKDKHQFYSLLYSLNNMLSTISITVSELSNEARFVLNDNEEIVYIIDGQNVYGLIGPGVSGEESMFVLIEGADAETFELVPSLGLDYARDKNSLYWEKVQLKNSDPLADTYIFEELFLVNGQNVYWKSQYLEGVNPDAMQFVSGERLRKVVQDGANAWVYIWGCYMGSFRKYDIADVPEYLASYEGC